MRGWKPRPPSPRIRARLFGPAQAERCPAGRLLWAWLAPALTVGLMVAWVLSRPGTRLAHRPGAALTGWVASVAVDSPHLVAYVAPWRHSSWNAWAGATFEWTNDAGAQTTAPPLLQTNGSIQ